ncbi:MAG: hypothetical protein R3E64_13970 [Halioglobus sp.]
MEQIADDFVDHYAIGGETGKAMLVCIDKITCVRMQEIILGKWKDKIAALKKTCEKLADEQAIMDMERKLASVHETIMAVVVSEEREKLKVP